MARKEIDSPRAPREIGGPGAAKAVVHYTDSLASALLYLFCGKGDSLFLGNLNDTNCLFRIDLLLKGRT